MIDDILFDKELILEVVAESDPGQISSFSLDGANFDFSTGEYSSVYIE